MSRLHMHIPLHEEIANFEKRPIAEQENIKNVIADVIFDSFVVTADEDYVTARLMAQKAMYRGFFWAASQTLEKYLKAFLLTRGRSVNEKRFNGHPLDSLFHAACFLEHAIKTISTAPHPKIKIYAEAEGSLRYFSAEDFIKEINKKGRSDTRYNAFGVSFNSAHLFALDSFVYHLRKQLGLSCLEIAILEKDEELSAAFFHYNPWFAQTDIDLDPLPNTEFPLRCAGSVTKFDWFITSPRSDGYREALTWLNQRMILPSEVKALLKDV